MIYLFRKFTIEEIAEIMRNATTAGYNVEGIINGQVYEIAGKEDTAK